MRYVSCKLRQITQTTNSIGVETETVEEVEIPIIRTERVYANEFYQASMQGIKPSLRLRISALNYDGQEELEYGGVIYTVARSETDVNDLILVCERKIRNIQGD